MFFTFGPLISGEKTKGKSGSKCIKRRNETGELLTVDTQTKLGATLWQTAGRLHQFRFVTRIRFLTQKKIVVHHLLF